jgi:hypothetical protein
MTSIKSFSYISLDFVSNPNVPFANGYCLYTNQLFSFIRALFHWADDMLAIYVFILFFGINNSAMVLTMKLNHILLLHPHFFAWKFFICRKIKLCPETFFGFLQSWFQKWSLPPFSQCSYTAEIDLLNKIK